MYVTRPLSHYYNNPNAVFDHPPEGPSSGILVIKDEEAESEQVCCWGLCKDSRIYSLPFPQNTKIKVRYTTTQHHAGGGQSHSTTHTSRDDVFFIPVTGQPLSSNRYYVIREDGRNKGKAATCSREEDMTTCCFCSFANDVASSPLDHRNIHQQVEIICQRNKFHAKAVASDGIPPQYLRRKGWQAYTSESTNYHLPEARGLDVSLRNKLPDLDFQISTQRSPAIVVGKWYCPFMFIKEGDRLKDQMKRSMFYNMTLQRFWEEIYSCENNGKEGNAVELSVGVRRHTALLNGSEIIQDRREVVDGIMWLKPVNSGDQGLGLSLAIWERMRWEEERGGWIGGEENVERVERSEVCEGENGWKKFGCYVLVERFVLKRMDGTVALAYDFKHTNKIRTKWE
ncbi:uncharacterized protein LOC103722417 [Phoenix dactylifera]|uniref:Uncharacterized protein LOC103722417 n=1 Tax=Phoenix dactylifera TaxID=42345 RepID=A0A8B7D235_PHODC|nr:uncharacterized protein LOC103722417 [Phoenix dactylifera]